MNIKILGNGSEFSLKSFNTSLLLTENNNNFLFDSGTDLRFALNKQNLSYKDINSVYISHNHQDHNCLEYLAYCAFYNPSTKHKPTLYGSIATISELKTIYSVSLNPLNKYFNINTVEDFIWEGCKFKLIKVPHTNDGIETYGLFITTTDDIKIYISGDSQFVPELVMEYYESADVIISDCETNPYRSGVHCHYDDLKTLPIEIKEKMYLVHVNDNVMYDYSDLGSYMITDDWMDKICQDGFENMPICGEDIELDFL